MRVIGDDYMELQEEQLKLNLKNQFFDLMDTNWSSLHYEELLKKALSIIKILLNVDEVALYESNNCKQIFLRASTDKNASFINHNLSTKELEELVSNKFVLRQPFPFSSLNQYDVLFPLKKDKTTCGYLALRGMMNCHYSDEIISECVQYLIKMDNLCEIIEQERRYKQLFRVTEKFHSSMDMDAVLGEIIHTLQEVYPMFTHYLMLSHDNNAHSNLPIKDLEYDSENVCAMQAYLTGTFQVEDSVCEKRTNLYAPLKGKQGVYGVLQVIAPNTMMFAKNEVEFITLLANTAGSALENAQLYQQSRRLISDLQLINETSHKLNSNLRLNEAISFMAEQIIASFGAEEVGFIGATEDFQNIKVFQGSTDFFFTDEATAYIQYMLKRIHFGKEPLFIGDMSFKDKSLQTKYKSIMAVPMIQSEVIKGFVLVMHQESYHFTFETFKLLQSLIHHSTLAFTNAILREEQEKMLILDHLTKLYSRNYLDEKIQRSMAKDEQGTFVLIDIDNFKQINDTYGHQVGDEVLIQVASIIQSNIRETDIGARWGGEELAIYFPKVCLDIGLLIAKRVVEKVSNETNPKVTISCGISYWNVETKDSFTTLFKRADLALYQAKETGKNKVVVQDRTQINI